MKWKRIRNAILLAVCAALLLTGCRNSAVTTEIIFTTGMGENVLFKIGSLSCSITEAKLVLANTKNQYEKGFGKEIWEQKIQGVPFETYVKDMVKNQLAQLTCMKLYAQEEGIELTEDMLSEINAAAEEYYQTLSDKEIEVLGITREEIEEIYKKYSIAYELFSHITRDVDQEISDAEAKVIVVQHIFKDTAGLNEQEERSVYYEMQEILRQLKEDGADFLSLAEESSDDQKTEYIFGRGEMEQSFEEAAFALEKEEISDIIETSAGYHIIRCVNDYDTDRTNTNKKTILENRRKKAFEDGYTEFVKTLLSEFNERVWEEVNFASIEEVKTSDIYNIYKKNLLDE